MAANDTTIVQGSVAKKVRNDLAKIAKDDSRSLANYLGRVITEHWEKVTKK